ncbi:NAD(P)-dependent oxidoreductase, partial [uncultured Selenomonas sp.]|uniref:NAD-dependent epimerase/dehydratase family protein n=1 Tax=uncultured Selenomonas sp. TaxID=159275 RepID=UPI00258DE985
VVTGATGAIGTALVRELVRRSVKVYAVCRPGSTRLSHLPSHPLVQRVMLDLHEIERLPEILGAERTAEGFYHLAWLGTANPNKRFHMRIQADNIRYTVDAAEAAHRLGCTFFVGAGSQAEYGVVDGILRPDTPTCPIHGYGMAKLCAGQMTRALCRGYGIRHIWARILSVYAFNDHPYRLINWTLRHLLEGKKPELTACEQVWDFLFADDAAEALFCMGGKGRDGAVYVLGSGEARPLRRYIETLRDMVNPQLPLGFGERPYMRDQVMHLEADITALVNDTGWRPRRSFAEGAQELLRAADHVRDNAPERECEG